METTRPSPADLVSALILAATAALWFRTGWAFLRGSGISISLPYGERDFGQVASVGGLGMMAIAGAAAVLALCLAIGGLRRTVAVVAALVTAFWIARLGFGAGNGTTHDTWAYSGRLPWWYTLATHGWTSLAASAAVVILTATTVILKDYTKPAPQAEA